MTERIFTKEECERELAKAEADVLIWATFLKVMERGDFVLTDDSKTEPAYRIAKHGLPIILAN